MNVEMIEEEEAYEEACGPSEQKPDLSDLENIILEGDIIVKVHADGEIEEITEKEWNIQRKSGVGEYCKDHHGDSNLYHHIDERLVKPGDTFQSHKEFVQYISAHAKRWCFYYKCTESFNVDTENETYLYNCVYLKNKEYKKKSLKKRYNSKTDCPCKIKLKRLPNEGLTVIYVCNHHDHELSVENFDKLVNTKKLPPYIKEVIMDLLSLEVEISKIRKYVEMETGIKMSRAFFYDIERKMKIYNEERHITDKRLKELSDKMTIVDEMYSCDEDDNTDEGNHSRKRNRGSKIEEFKKKKKTLTFDNTMSDQETLNSVQILKESLNDISKQDISWTNDQCVPGTKSRNTSTTWDVSSIANTNDESTLNTEDDTQDYTENCDNTEDYTTTEYTANTETETNNQTNNQYEYQTVVLQDEFGNIINCDDNQQIVILQQDGNNAAGEGETIGYFDGEKIIYVSEGNQQNDINASDVVQTNNQKPGHSYVPVFDVCLKDGNVTGFVVNDNAMKKWGVEKGVQTPEDTIRDLAHIQAAPIEPRETSTETQEILEGDTYTKHEYIHRYNIDHYMAKPNFPKYIDTLAKKTRNDVLHMLTRVYNEKAMFKLTTTQRGREGNTKIWYLTDVRRKGQYKMSDEEKRKRDKIGQYLTDILILKERVKSLKKENDELITRNKYLEEVALRLANMRN